MLNKIKINGISWSDWVYSTDKFEKKELANFLRSHDFHELDIEACLEENQNPRMDSYDDYIFITLHFPKYNKKTKRYILDEFNVFLAKDKIITLKHYKTNSYNHIFSKYSNLNIKKEEDFKITTAYILYEILQALLEKIFKFIENANKDIRYIENEVFINPNEELIREIMIKNRNTVVLKHMLKPQINVLKMLERKLNIMFKEEEGLEPYFEDLEDKIERLFIDIQKMEENLSSIEDALKSLISIKTWFIMRILALVSTFFLPLTLVTSFYWMNIKLPFEKNSFFVYFIILIVSLFSFLALWFIFRWKKF